MIDLQTAVDLMELAGSSRSEDKYRSEDRN